MYIQVVRKINAGTCVSRVFSQNKSFYTEKKTGGISLALSINIYEQKICQWEITGRVCII